MVLRVQAVLTFVANEVIVLVIAEGAGSTSTHGLGDRLVVVAGDDIDGSASTVFRLAGKTYIRTPVTASSSPSSCRERWGWRRAVLQQGESGEGERGENGEGERDEWRRRW
jgi:hypothetical protein